jgi:cellulose biosynthesis protein BcsQ
VLFAEGIIEPSDIPKDIIAAYLVGQNDIDKVEEFTAICKFQKYEILFKQIMDLCLEREVTHYTKKNILGNITKLIFVTSASGGVGTSTVAVAVSKHIAMAGKKVLYLSLENNAITDIFFKAEDELTFSDVIYTIKSKKTNMISRVENIVQKDDSGVYFFRPCRTVFDMNELNAADIENLISQICSMGSYDYIIVDTKLNFDSIGYFLCDYADDIILVSDARVSDTIKLRYLKEAFDIWDEKNDARFTTKTNILYNKVGSHSAVKSEDLGYDEIGIIPKYDSTDEKTIADQISRLNYWKVL